jgi:hypothetical protein
MSQPPILSSYTDAAPDGAVLTKRGVANGHANGQLNGHANGHANGQVASTKQANKPAVAPIDWEIPRKALHSSIGTSLCRQLSRAYADFRPPSTLMYANTIRLPLALAVDLARFSNAGDRRS